MKFPVKVLKNVLAGFLIGVGCVLPGVSGGVIAMSFGLYRPMLDVALHFFRSPMKHLRFLFPIGVGGTAGLIAGAGLLASLMAEHREMMLLLFTGFIIGGLPQLWRNAVREETFRKSWIGWLAAGIALALPLSFLGMDGVEASVLSPMQMFLTGLLEGFGTVVPGVSTSFVLIRLGWYQAYLRILSAPSLLPVCLIGTGFGLSAFACMKLIQWLFQRAPGRACSAVTGFLLVSVAVVFPGFHAPPLFFADAGLMVIGAVISYWMGSMESPDPHKT